MMKKIGILGGLAWPSTVEYYAGICRLVEQQNANAGLTGPAAMPEMIIASLDAVTAASLFGNDAGEASWKAFDAYHRDALQELERAGADFAVIACNTAHHRFAQITRGLRIPVLNIVEAAARVCAWTEVRRLLILGTPPVMHSPVFREAFAHHGIQARCPRSEHDLCSIRRTIAALQRGRIDGASDRIADVASRSIAKADQGSVAIYLGCTELPLAFPSYQRASVFTFGGIRYINSTALHIRAAFEYATSTATPPMEAAAVESHSPAEPSSGLGEGQPSAPHPSPALAAARYRNAVLERRAGLVPRFARDLKAADP